MTRHRLAMFCGAALFAVACGDRELTAPQPTAHSVEVAPAEGFLQPGSIAQLDAGGCVVRTDETILCWGLINTAKATLPVGHFREVSVGGSHNCALTTSDAIVCWGENQSGETAPPVGRFAHLTSGWSHSCALAIDGTIACWGANGHGQATAPTGTFTQVSARANYTCALRTDTSIACWGQGAPATHAPTRQGFTRVSAGIDHACAIDRWPDATLPGNDHHIVCWGRADYDNGQRRPADGHFTEVSVYDYSCGIMTDGRPNCWDAPDPVWYHPVWGAEPPPPGTVLVQLSAGEHHACGLTPQREMVCWGYPQFGWGIPPRGPVTAVDAGSSRFCFAGLSDGDGRCMHPGVAPGDQLSGSYADLFMSGPLGPALGISVTNRYACAIRADGTTPCWGYFPPVVPTSSVATLSLAVDWSGFGCAVRTDGLLRCWGDQWPEFGPWELFKAVSVGATESCAIRASGTLACWPAAHAAVPPEGTFSSVSVRAGTVGTVRPSGPNDCAIRTDGTVVCWNPSTPVPAGTFTKVDVAETHVCGLRTDATIMCWGDNQYGQATAPPGQYRDVAASGAISCAVTVDLRPVCWGQYKIVESSLPTNRAPVALVGGPYVGAEGSPLTLALSGTDPDGDILTFTWDFGDGTTGSGATPPGTHTYADNGSYTIRLTVSDGKGGETTGITTATIANVAPSIPAGGLAAPLAPQQMIEGSVDVPVSVRFSDPAGSHDSYSAVIGCGNGMTLRPEGISSPYAASCRYTKPGIYTATASVSDEDGGTSATAQYQYVLVYDPAGAFVTGGGWFDTPAGACPTLCGGNNLGKAHFTIEARFQPGQPDAPAGLLKFWLQGKKALDVSTTKLSMMITWDDRVQIWGPAVVNGSPGYLLRISGIDDRSADRVRVELFDSIGARVYDSQWGAPRDATPATEIQGGQLVIHSR